MTAFIELVEGGTTAAVEEFSRTFSAIFGMEPDVALIEDLVGIPQECAARYRVGTDSTQIWTRGLVTDNLSWTIEVKQQFFRDGSELVAVLDELQVEASEPVGRGSSILDRQFETFLRLHVDELRVEAAGVGQYLWPRLGFELRRAGDMQLVQAFLGAWLLSQYAYGDPLEPQRLARTYSNFAQILAEPFGKSFLLALGGNLMCPALKMVLSLRDAGAPSLRATLAYLSAERSEQ